MLRAITGGGTYALRLGFLSRLFFPLRETSLPGSASLRKIDAFERLVLRSRGASILLAGVVRLGRVMPVILLVPTVDTF